MMNTEMNQLEVSPQQHTALSRWDNEGGAGPDGPQAGSCPDGVASGVPLLTNTELVQLRIRVIALENVIIGLLANAPYQQLEVVLGMADFISPRPGFTQHALTIQAATQMRNLVERAGHFRHLSDGDHPVAKPYKRSPVFDEQTLPAGLRNEHRTKQGVWGVIRLLEGRVRYRTLDPPSEMILDAVHPGLVSPDVAHSVEPLGPMRMYVEFYKQAPDLKTLDVASMVPIDATSTKVC